MAMQETAVCPAGHPQDYVRGDRSGRCTECGNALVVGVYDDALTVGKRVDKRTITADEPAVKKKKPEQ